jgi:hypothetical protein
MVLKRKRKPTQIVKSKKGYSKSLTNISKQLYKKGIPFHQEPFWYIIAIPALLLGLYVISPGDKKTTPTELAIIKARNNNETSINYRDAVNITDNVTLAKLKTRIDLEMRGLNKLLSVKTKKMKNPNIIEELTAHLNKDIDEFNKIASRQQQPQPKIAFRYNRIELYSTEHQSKTICKSLTSIASILNLFNYDTNNQTLHSILTSNTDETTVDDTTTLKINYMINYNYLKSKVYGNKIPDLQSILGKLELLMDTEEINYEVYKTSLVRIFEEIGEFITNHHKLLGCRSSSISDFEKYNKNLADVTSHISKKTSSGSVSKMFDDLANSTKW